MELPRAASIVIHQRRQSILRRFEDRFKAFFSSIHFPTVYASFVRNISIRNENEER